MTGPPPAPDQIELTLFGPGYGECTVVHLGAGCWAVVDSCIDFASGRPAALDYLAALGLPPDQAVRLVVATHWHDDHIRGLAEVVARCPEAVFCCPAPLLKQEFLARVLDYESGGSLRATSGVHEIAEIFRVLRTREPARRVPRNALANRPVFAITTGGLPPRASATVTALSPSDREYERFLESIGALVPVERTTKRRAPAPESNDLALALWVEAGPVRLLLGSDLEDRGDPVTGWSAVVASAERPQGRAAVFKIPHHGSVTGHHDQVWDDMLVPSPYAVVSPFRRGTTKLPSSADVARIAGRTPHGFLTSRESPATSKRKRPPSVERTIRETVGRLRTAQPRMGWVRLRNGGTESPEKWAVELSESACPLQSLL